jgi:hypothetical protein
MKIGRRLKKTQSEIDFVDIDPEKDIQLYVDPQLIAASPHPFAEACHTSIEGFFSHFLALLKTKDSVAARALFSHLHEPNETCLGQSSGAPNGRGIGSEQADQLFESIRQSKAAKTGLLEHLEDCAIFVPGIGGDKVSDMTTNVVRGHLVAYTQDQCKLHGLPLVADTPMGPIWDNVARRWIFIRTDALVLNGRPILFVPKSFVSFAKNYTTEKYHRHFVLNFICREQLATNGPFVHRRERRDGTERVWVVKKEVQDNIAPADKEWVAGFTLQHASLFKQFRKWAKERAQPLTNAELKSAEDVGVIAAYLASELLKIRPGNAAATAYHHLVLGVLELLFYPSLTCPRKETEIHEGRKRIDITFDNSARFGFFWDLHQIRKLPCQYIVAECKNYGREIGNPEIDQLSSRFGPNRGQVGFLLCRSLENRERLIRRCQDTYRDSRGLVLPLTDDDLKMLLDAKAQAPLSRPGEEFLKELAREIILA